MKIFNGLMLLTIAIFLAACGGSNARFQKSPIDELIRQMNAEPDFSIILYDMNYDESSRDYQHKYQIIVPRKEQDTVESSITDWKMVSPELFKRHVNDMGMEIVSKVNGKVKKAAVPPGYNHYVGNEKYGRWVQRDGNSFWEFYGKYAFMSSMFHMMSYPVYRSHYNDYYNNYRWYSRSYYGPNNNGRTYYGTRSSYNQSRKSAWNQKSNSFKSKVRDRVSRSRSTYSKRSRSGSRYSSSSFRSRGGGFGK